MKNGFAKDISILEENHQVDDLLDFSSITADFKKTLDGIKTNSVKGLVGKFGSGKSTMLYQIYKDKANSKTEKWISFDAWKYPERKDLWEGFVLDFARQLDPKVFDAVRKKIDGTSNDDKKTLIKTIADIPIPGFSAIENINHFFETSPARRVFEIQEILKDIIKKKEEEIFIIIEDIDRSGDMGIFFLETLRNFIKNNDFKKKIIVIVPIGTEVFKEGKASYGKCLDYQFDFKSTAIDFSKFIEAVFDDKFLKQGSFSEQVNFLFKQALRQKDLSIRDFKKIIRNANIQFSKLDENTFDLRVFILYSIFYQTGGPFYVDSNKSKIINSTIFGYDFLIWVANTNQVVTNHNSYNSLKSYLDAHLPVVLVHDETSNIPKITDPFLSRVDLGDEKHFYVLSDKYLNYFGLAW